MERRKMDLPDWGEGVVSAPVGKRDEQREKGPHGIGDALPLGIARELCRLAPRRGGAGSEDLLDLDGHGWGMDDADSEEGEKKKARLVMIEGSTTFRKEPSKLGTGRTSLGLALLGASSPPLRGPSAMWGGGVVGQQR